MKSILQSIPAGVLLASLAFAQPYTVTDLGTLAGGSFSQATYINNNGLITGVSTNADGALHAVVWVGGKIKDLATVGLGGVNSAALGIRNGKVAGGAESSQPDPNQENFCAYGTGLRCLPMLWQGGVMSPLPLLGGYNGAAGPLNGKGQVVGVAETGIRDPDCPTTPAVNGTGPQALAFEAVVWGPAPGQMRPLRPLPGDTVGQAFWINDLGQVAGASGSCANTIVPPFAGGAHAIIWETDGSVHDLGNLGGTPNPAVLAILNAAFAINNSGQVAGVSPVPASLPGSLNQNTHAFLWTKAHGMQDLGTLPGDVNSAGLAMNDKADVVGASVDGDPITGSARAYLWHNGKMHDLNSLVPADSPLYLLTAFGINDAGQIVGFGVTAAGDIHGFLASPVTSDAAIESGPTASRHPVITEAARKFMTHRGRSW